MAMLGVDPTARPAPAGPGFDHGELRLEGGDQSQLIVSIWSS